MGSAKQTGACLEGTAVGDRDCSALLGRAPASAARSLGPCLLPPNTPASETLPRPPAPPLPQPVPRKGEDPSHDAREKALSRLATRGVVLLFNAVNKAQKQRAEADAVGGVGKRKAAVAKLSKSSFLTELKQAAETGVPVDAAISGAGAAAKQQQAQQQRREGGGRGAGWEVLGEGFPGLTGGSKMRDWDRRASSGEEDEVGEQPRLAEAEISSDEADGW